jgi:hypothetical protein
MPKTWFVNSIIWQKQTWNFEIFYNIDPDPKMSFVVVTHNRINVAKLVVCDDAGIQTHGQGCQIFLDTGYQNRKKCSK